MPNSSILGSNHCKHAPLTSVVMKSFTGGDTSERPHTPRNLPAKQICWWGMQLTYDCISPCNTSITGGCIQESCLWTSALHSTPSFQKSLYFKLIQLFHLSVDHKLLDRKEAADDTRENRIQHPDNQYQSFPWSPSHSPLHHKLLDICRWYKSCAPDWVSLSFI